ncbi:alpha/beta hydrolase fold protein [Beutenbergia cavernae DSM 12333]|uniref:Alpha/beta hydrolase fold protein n=1 Tax=Beutenbergia cavernae (strain ATCC BAA-8 / DSM 12333 / CCUG 43141 / JCM 11478 / NBRC 16432 / NCIMB 13614 / HKI 0122) TaxID=471853 RepID=C5BZS7_BEUC1|nr:alpha/beta hydrolase [Beutenbergia cavernae]ACQ81257.1 alpha/beta hydrolase fold protein [Beutenbergia cavernae DSM 12333]
MSPARELTATSGDVTLAGSLWLPDGDPGALVLMHPGSGPSDRHNDVFFPPIRAALLAAGAAVCSYDKRGVGGSGGDWLTAGIPEQADDVVAGLAAARPHVGGVPVILFGHSQGGWVVLAAAGAAGADAVVTSSGPGVSPGVQERHATRRHLGDAPHAAADAALFDELMDLASAGASASEARAWLEQPDRAPGLDRLRALGAFVPDGDDLWGLAVRLVDADPAPDLRALRVPLLAVFGAQDPAVPVQRSLEVLREEVRPDLLDVVVLDGGHRLEHPETDELAPDYVPTLVRFVEHVARAAGG